MTAARTPEQLADAAYEVTREWTSLAELAIALKDQTTSAGVRAGLVDGFLSCDRALILFICGGEDGRRDKRDITPKDFLGTDWWPADEELDQRLRGRLGVMSRQRAHLSWDRVLNEDIVLWPFSLLAWEACWAMRLFVRELAAASAACTELFQTTERQVLQTLGKPERWRVSTSEYGRPRQGQTDRRMPR